MTPNQTLDRTAMSAVLEPVAASWPMAAFTADGQLGRSAETLTLDGGEIYG
jgi:hypothetical protein